MDADGVGGTGRTEGDTTKVAEDGDGAVGFGVLADYLSRGDVLEAVGEEVGVGVAEDQGAELGDGNETGGSCE